MYFINYVIYVSQNVKATHEKWSEEVRSLIEIRIAGLQICREFCSDHWQGSDTTGLCATDAEVSVHKLILLQSCLVAPNESVPCRQAIRALAFTNVFNTSS